MNNVYGMLLLLLCGMIMQTSGQLYADDVSDGKCTLNKIAENFTSCTSAIMIPKVYTISIGSKAMFRTYAESFLGRPAKDQDELDAMCYRNAFFESISVSTGYGNKTNIRTVIPTELDPSSPFGSPPFGIGKFKVGITLAESAGSTTKNQFMSIDQVVWCDSSHVLIVRCVNGTRQDWKVSSVGNPEPWVFPFVKQIIKGIGMPEENAMEYKSAHNGGKCPDAPDLITFSTEATKNVFPPIPFLG